jgi:hypothetical protein
MKQHAGRAVALAVVTATLSSCGLGYNRMLFVTKTNIGMDIDSKPPTAEISVARREGVIAPTFDGAKTPPVMGGFRYEGSWWDPRVSAVFSGGKAALTVSKLFTSTSATDPTPQDSKLCAKELPKSRILAFFSKIPVLRAFTEEGDRARPFFFATDTGTGLKVAWSGTGGSFPDSLKFGYNRKEYAFAPVFAQDLGEQRCKTRSGQTDAQADGRYEIDSPSFLATLDNDIDAKAFTTSSYSFSQFFATGQAAENLALQPAVRAVLGKRMDPSAFDAAQQALDKQREEAAPLIKEAHGLIDGMATDAALDDARDKARTAGLLGTTEDFPPNSDVAAKKTFLKAVSTVGDNKERLAALKKFVAALKGE